MSTKIYTGIKFKDSDLQSIGLKLKTACPSLYQMQQSRVYRFLVLSAVDQLDAIAHSPGEVPAEGLVDGALGNYWERTAKLKSTNRRDPAVDTEITITCGVHDGSVIGLVRSEFANSVINVLTQAQVASTFNYWNNDEPDPDVSESEWDARGKIWDEVLGTDAGLLFTYTIEDPLGLSLDPPLSAFQSHVLAPEARAKKHATNFMLQAAGTYAKISETLANMAVPGSPECLEYEALVKRFGLGLVTAEQAYAAWHTN